ncbi:MAG: hypothetical protein PH343_09925 [Nitrospira sp.]|nr:hypothetical protein [Nitrospira sp.]
MEETNVDEFRKRAEDLVKEWRLSRTLSRTRGLDLGVDLTTALAAFKYIPYILATIYYSWMDYKIWSEHKVEKDVKINVNLWIDESIDRVLQLAPTENVDEENCRNDMIEVVKTLTEKVRLQDLTSASDILSNRIFKILQKYYPDAEIRERELVDYIVRAELTRLNGLS